MSIPFTAHAYQDLKNRLHTLSTERKATMQRLIQAREQGDLSENGAYKYAKIELGTIGREMRRLKQLLNEGQIVEKKTGQNTVDFLSVVTLLLDKSPVTYTMVSLHESNFAQNKLSLESPIGMAIKGKSKGAVVSVETPTGSRTITILDVQ